MTARECVNCRRDLSNEGNNWRPGQFLLFEMLLCCSPECAVRWCESHAVEVVPERDISEPASAGSLVSNAIARVTAP